MQRSGNQLLKSRKKPTGSPKDSIRPTIPDSISPTNHSHTTVTASHLFSDAAWNSSSCAGGLGWVIKSSSGNIFLHGSSPKRYVASALAAEALALKEGLSKAILAGLKDIVCSSDSRCLIQLLTGNKSVTAIKWILHDICVLSQSLNSISYHFIARSCNVQADELAKNFLFLLSCSS